MSDNEDFNIEESDVDKKDDDDDKTIDDVLSAEGSDSENEIEIEDDSEKEIDIDDDDEDDDIYGADDDDDDAEESDSDSDVDLDNDETMFGGADEENPNPKKGEKKAKQEKPKTKKQLEKEALEAKKMQAKEALRFQKPKIYDSDEDENEADDENYLQKFDKEINRNYILEHHPECVNHNYDEIVALSKVVRDKDNNIVDQLHRTIPFLTKFEKARVLGQRAKQIESGARPFVEVPDKIIEGSVIALLELQQKRLPFIIRRPLPSGGSEYWNLQDLDMIDF
jgi:DNA-directed RNA polymerase I, II, and III subunit RPABC2